MRVVVSVSKGGGYSFVEREANSHGHGLNTNVQRNYDRFIELVFTTLNLVFGRRTDRHHHLWNLLI